jgi:hypothetical protein
MPATRRTSAPIMRCTCRDVAATARSSAISLRRCRTDSASVLATTIIAIMIAVPANDSDSTISIERTCPTSRNSTSPRSSPV